MKRFTVILFSLVMGSAIWAQDVFTLVYATSDDGFLNVRQSPSAKSRVLTTLYEFNHGLGTGVYRGQSGNWTKVSVGKITGYAYTKYIGYQNWFNNNGAPKLVANAPVTPIYIESYEDAAKHPLFTTVKKGTIIADEFYENGEYYELHSAHDFLFIKKTDAIVVK